MALLTAEEKAKLAEGGLWVREKCDSCGKPILSPVTYIKKGKVICSSCVKGQDFTLSNIKEENEMKVKKAAARQNKEGTSQSKKVGGVLIAGSAIAELYELLSDGKKHTFKEGEKICVRHKRDLKGRLGNLRRVGERKRTWGLIVDDEGETIQMKMGAPDKSSSSAAPAKKTTPKKEQEPEEKEAVPSKALKATAALVRRTLKSGKDWTKNKLIEHLKSEHDQDPKRIEAALKDEIKAGGIEVDDGVLTLA